VWDDRLILSARFALQYVMSSQAHLFTSNSEKFVKKKRKAFYALLFLNTTMHLSNNEIRALVNRFAGIVTVLGIQRKHGVIPSRFRFSACGSLWQAGIWRLPFPLSSGTEYRRLGAGLIYSIVYLHRKSSLS